MPLIAHPPGACGDYRILGSRSYLLRIYLGACDDSLIFIDAMFGFLPFFFFYFVHNAQFTSCLCFATIANHTCVVLAFIGLPSLSKVPVHCWVHRPHSQQQRAPTHRGDKMAVQGNPTTICSPATRVCLCASSSPRLICTIDAVLECETVWRPVVGVSGGWVPRRGLMRVIAYRGQEAKTKVSRQK